MKRFKDFIVNEKNSENEVSYEQFVKDVKKAVMKDFSATSDYAEEFLNLYEEELLDSWRNGYSVREAIAATEIPGVRISDEKVDESYIYTIDDKFENIYSKIKESNKINHLISVEKSIDEYYKTYYRKTFSDVRIFERVKNNYNRLIKLYEDKKDNIQNEMDMKIYDINTWKYLMFEPSKEIGIIEGIESIRTGSALTKKELAENEEESDKIYIKHGYKLPERHSHKSDWYKHMDIRFNVRTESGSASWHIKKVLPLTEESFIRLGGKDFQKRSYKNNDF